MRDDGDSSFPNLFLVGAPKCGTTSVAAALRQHPQVFLGASKEPWYLNEDFGPRKITREEDYLEHFRCVRRRYRFLCDASTTYLYSQAALEAVSGLPDSRVIIMVRNPIDMALSWHAQKRLTLEEDIEDFESAWRAIAARKQGESVPRVLRERRWLYYDDMAALGTRSAKWLDALGSQRVKIGFLEDLERDPAGFFRDLFGFLGLTVKEIPTGVHENRRSRPRSVRLAGILGTAARVRRKVLPIQLGLNLFSKLQLMNRVPDSRARNISGSFEAELAAHFRHEVEILEGLTGRKLAWLDG